ncbi:MAG: AsmA-like C-terminal region-containing protein, partial [Bradyrhizobium sp.]
TEKQRISLVHGDIGTKELGSHDDKDVTIALSGQLDYGGTEPRLAMGVAGNKMSVAALKRLWPAFVSPKVRDWVLEHIVSGNVDRLDIATNAPLVTLQSGGPPIPEDGLSIEIAGNNVTLNPVEGLPPIRDADLNVRVTGRTATVTLGKGSVEVSPGRKLAITNGVLEVPNMRPVAPQARVRMRVEGTVPAAAELLALDRLREFSGAPFDPTTTRGMAAAQINLSLPLRPDLPKGSTDYNIAVDLTNFSADKLLLGQKVEAQLLHASATNQQYEIKGDVKIAGAPAEIDYVKLAGEAEAEIKLTATLDEASRARLGLDVGNSVAGPLPVRLTGRVGADDREGKFSVEANLTPARIENLLPGWVKPPGRPARATFTLVKGWTGVRFDDLLVDGPGILAKGTIDIDTNGDLLGANFPVFATSDGDKASLKVDRGADGALRVVMRGDVYDGRNFIKMAMAGPNDPKVRARHPDLDIDVKLGVVAGHNGEALRGLDLRLSRRGGRVRTFSLNAKIGRDTPLIGDMRTRTTNGRPVIYFETNDAGALFRFTDTYSRMVGGKMWMGMDPPTQDSSPQDGLINVRDFTIRGETALDRVASGAQNPQFQNNNSIDFTQARADFVRVPGRMTIRDGVVRGPMIGATMEGNIDYAHDQIHVRGTLVPLYGLNNMFGQIPIVGLFLGGGSNEGIFGITYEVTGSTSNPRPVVNPISAIAPGLLRKFFEFRDVNQDRTFAEPSLR